MGLLGREGAEAVGNEAHWPRLEKYHTASKCRGHGEKDPGGAMICENNGRETREKKV